MITTVLRFGLILEEIDFEVIFVWERQGYPVLA